MSRNNSRMFVVGRYTINHEEKKERNRVYHTVCKSDAVLPHEAIYPSSSLNSVLLFGYFIVAACVKCI